MTIDGVRAGITGRRSFRPPAPLAQGAHTWQVLALDANSLLLGSGPQILSAASATKSVTRVSPVLRTLVADDVEVSATTPITIVGGDFGGYVTRTDGLSWKAAGFQEGQLVMIQGLEGAWRLRRIEGSNDQTLRLERGAVLPTFSAPTTRTYFAAPERTSASAWAMP